MAGMVVETENTQLCYRILENTSTAILLFDQERQLLYANNAAETLFGVSARQLIGCCVSELLKSPGDVIEGLVLRAQKEAQPLTERALPMTLEGRSATVDCTVNPISSHGYPLELLVELQQVDRQLRISREGSLVSQHRATRALVRGLAHEIKNPLGGLRGAAQLLERELPDPELWEYTQIIISEADRLQKLVDRMLGPNRLPQKRPVNLHQLLERVRGLVEAEAAPGDESKGLRIERDYDPSIPEFPLDPDQIIQALLNIVRNAVQALDGSGTIWLRTRIQRQYTIAHKRHRLAARIDIIDDGPGILPEMRDSLFFPMVTGRAEGTGLGLSIAQSLINQHEGLIECVSNPGETIFTVLIPMETEDDE